MKSVLLMAIYILSAGIISGGNVIIVDISKVIRAGADSVVGININYIKDHDDNRPAGSVPLSETLGKMGVNWLRYPGGEKSDFHFWSTPPYEKPDVTSCGWYSSPDGKRLDFDEYISLCREVGAEPFVVTAYDSEKRTRVTKEEFLEHAVSWVRYSNIVKKYNVKYWEIGNENWHNNTGSPQEIAEIVSEFSQAMKAVDPSIKIGASGNNQKWWNEFLQKAAPHLDFITLSLYNTWNWKSYDYYVKHPRVNLINEVRQAETAIRALPEEHRNRINIFVTETNSKDYSDKHWPDDNSLGHAIVTADTFGELIKRPNVFGACLWNTRWMGKDEKPHQSIWYGLGERNEIMPSGRAVALWGEFAGEKMVACSGFTDSVKTFASYSEETGELTLIIINRSLQELGKDYSFQIEAQDSFILQDARVFHGTGPDDTEPKWEKSKSGACNDNILSALEMPGPSIIAVVLEKVPEVLKK